MKALLSAVVRIPSSFSQLSSPSRFHFHIKKIWGYIWRICLKIKNWISRSTTLTKARRRLKREIKSSFQESQTILNGLLTVLPQNIQGETILFNTAFFIRLSIHFWLSLQKVKMKFCNLKCILKCKVLFHHPVWRMLIHIYFLKHEIS